MLKDPQVLQGSLVDRAHRVPLAAAALQEDKERKGQLAHKGQPGQPGALVQLAFSAQLLLRWESTQQRGQLEH